MERSVGLQTQCQLSTQSCRFNCPINISKRPTDADWMAAFHLLRALAWRRISCPTAIYTWHGDGRFFRIVNIGVTVATDRH